MKEIKFEAVFDGKIVEYIKWQEGRWMYSEDGIFWYFRNKYAHSELRQCFDFKGKKSNKTIYKLRSLVNRLRRVPPPFFSEIWYGVYDKTKQKVIYLYPDESAAKNQASRGGKQWTVNKVVCNY